MTTVDDGWFVEFRYYFDFKDEGTIKIQKGRITFFLCLGMGIGTTTDTDTDTAVDLPTDIEETTDFNKHRNLEL
jgi:hypothetical protein